MTEKKELVYTKPKLKLGYGWGHCPGCHHPIVEKLVCEVLEEMDLAEFHRQAEEYESGDFVVGRHGLKCYISVSPNDWDQEDEPKKQTT